MSAINRSVFIKRKDSRLDYDFDWTDLLGEDTISAAVVTSDPLGLTLESPLVVSPVVKVFISGGTLGEDYLVKCKMTSTAGLIDVLDFWLKVR